MTVETIGEPFERPDGSILPFSMATKANGFIFVSGHMGVDENLRVVDGGIEAQTTRCLRNIEAVLHQAGATLNDVAKVQVWLTDLADFAGFNRAYLEVFGDHLPARSTTQSELVLPNSLIEIELIAVDPGG
ncbi:MAG: RidA family protein [Actinomycetota bacterium]